MRSEGNAFFTRQLTRALQEQGGLIFAEGRWDLSIQDMTVTAPESIRSVIGQRLGRLTEHTQEVLREASVLGQVFAFDDLRGMSQRGEQEVEEALDEAASKGIVREGQRDHYHFNHALTLETLYADLSARRKRRLHCAAGEAIEQAPDHERRAAELSYHFLAADESERALPYALLAGDQAEAVYAHAAAEGHYRAALAMACEVGDQARQAETLKKLGAAVGALGRYDEAIQFLERALHSYKSLQDQVGELYALAALLEIQGEFGREMLAASVERAQTTLARLEPPDLSALSPALASGLAAVYSGLAMLYIGTVRSTKLLAASQRAVELARLAGDESQLVVAQHRLYTAGNDSDVGLAAWEEQRALAKRVGQTKFLVFAHNMIGERHAEAGEFALGIPDMEQSLAVAEQRGDPNFLAWQLNNFTYFLLLCGDWQRARSTAARAKKIIKEVDPLAVTWHAAGISIWPGEFALLEGREDEGRTLLDLAISKIEQVGVSFMLDLPTCFLAEADLLAGHPLEARRRLTALLENPAVSDDLMFAPLLAWAEGALGQYEEAEQRLEAILARALARVQSDALRMRGLLAIMQSRSDMAAEALDEALARTPAMPYPYAELKTLWAYGRLEMARDNLAAARVRFEEALAICDRLGEGLYRKCIERDLVTLNSSPGPTRP